MFEDPKEPKSEDMVELLEELTLSTEPQADVAALLQDDHLSVDLRGEFRLADRSRRAGGPIDARLIRIAPREFTLTSSEPMFVGDHYVVSFDPDELAFESADHSVMRCTGCVESQDSPETYRATLRPFVDIDLRRALGGSSRTR